jgi:hypothetical protein
VPDLDEGMFKEFMEFMTAKRQAEADNDDGDEEVEIWNKEGAGARVKKRDAKPFLQSLGLLPDPPAPTNDDDDGKGKDKGKTRPTGRTAATTTAGQSTVRKYFSKG